MSNKFASQGSHESPADRLDRRLEQAVAIATTFIGEGFESFKTWNDEVQQNALWALHDLIDDARRARDEISAQRKQGDA